MPTCVWQHGRYRRFKEEQIDPDSVLMNSLSGGDGGGGAENKTADMNEKVLGRTKASRPKSSGVVCSGISEDVARRLRPE